MPRCCLNLAACCLLLVLAACSAGRQAPPESAAAQARGDGLLSALPALDSLALQLAPRSSQALSSYEFSAADLKSADSAQMTGNTLELQTAEVSWAVLGAAFPGVNPTQLSVSGTADNLYLLVADYGLGRWRYVAGPLGSGGSFALPDGVLRADDSCFVALLCPDNRSSSVSVQLTLSDGVPLPGQSVSGALRTEADWPLQGVSLTLSGAGNLQTNSDASGNFSFAAVPPGNYTLTPLLADHAFIPASRSITVAATPLSGQNFSATLEFSDVTAYAFRLDIGDAEPQVLRPAKGINIDIYVEPGVGVPGWEAAFDTAFKEAVLNWNALSDPWGLFHLRLTDIEANAEIVVSWRQTFNNGTQVGEANVGFFVGGPIDLPYTIEMATENSDGPVDAGVVRKAGVHEVGHCLGLWAHSDANTDIMFPSVSTFELPSRRDLLTLYTLFNTPTVYTTDGRGPSAAGPRERRTISMD